MADRTSTIADHTRSEELGLRDQYVVLQAPHQKDGLNTVGAVEQMLLEGRCVGSAHVAVGILFRFFQSQGTIHRKTSELFRLRRDASRRLRLFSRRAIRLKHP